MTKAKKKQKKQKKSKIQSKKKGNAKRKIKYPFSGHIVKRIDSRGRRYYVEKGSNARVSEADYIHDRERLEFDRASYRQAIKDDLDSYANINPFPTDVGPTGVPTKLQVSDFVDVEGESFDVDDFEAIPIEGEDETG